MSRFVALALAVSAVFSLPGLAAPQGQHFPLDSADGLELYNVTAEPATLQGKKGLRITTSEEAIRRLKEQGPDGGPATAQIARVEGVDFSNGTIEAEIAGAPAPGAAEGARGFVGIGFRLQDDNRTFDEFYLRPTNGRAEDQERRNHSVQYVSHPDWPWFRLRKETPSKYEAYVDLVPGQWTKVKIEVSGERARLYVHDNEQPTLIVNDVKSGANAKGGIALCIGPGTVAHFRNLTVAGQAGGTASSR
jgi:hypothetical protein